MRVALYARVSSDRQEREATIESQIEADRAFARTLPPHQLVTDGGSDVFADDGFPGNTLERPAMTRLRALLRLKAIDALVVYDIDRLSRDEPDLYALVYREIVERGITLYIAKTGARFEDTDEGHLLFALFAAFARLERKRIGERARRGGKHRAKVEGRKNGGIPSFGFDLEDGRYVLNPEEVAWCRRMRDWLLEGVTPGRIANRLVGTGVPTKYDTLGIVRKGSTRARATWYPDQVRRILTHRLYAGEWVYRSWDGDETVVPVPAIFTRDELEAHQRIVDRNRSLKPRVDGGLNILRSLVVCGGCGRRYVAAYTGKVGESQRVYRCGSWNRIRTIRDCSNKSWTARRLEGIVWREVAALIEDPAAVLAALEERRRPMDRPELRIAQLEARLAALDAEDERVRAGYRAGGLYSIDQAQAELGRSDRVRAIVGRELAEIRARVATARETADRAEALEATLVVLRERLPQLSQPDRGAVLRELVDRVTVTGNRVEIEVVLPTKRDRLADPVSGAGRLVLTAR